MKVASQVALMVKNLSANAGDVRDVGSIPGFGRYPGEGHGNPLQYSCLENPYGQRTLEGYSPWGRKESDMTERLSTAKHRHFPGGTMSKTPRSPYRGPGFNPSSRN